MFFEELYQYLKIVSTYLSIIYKIYKVDNFEWFNMYLYVNIKSALLNL